jgi:hypothetical protein
MMKFISGCEIYMTEKSGTAVMERVNVPLYPLEGDK